jgi:cytochrome d ubiquinol oxidase subunit I
MAFLDPRAFVPGIQDLVKGNPEQGIIAYDEKIQRGKIAINTLKEYKRAVESGEQDKIDQLTAQFQDQQFLDNYFAYFGYGYYDDPKDLIPSVPVSFYSFHIMVILGVHFMILFLLTLIYLFRDKLENRNKRWFLWVSIFTIPLVYLASMAGWMVAEFGRQPWVIQDLMPTVSAVSRISTSSVQITFWLFVVLFTALFLAEIRIMLAQIKKGPKEVK